MTWLWCPTAREGASCVFGGTVYKSGETFQSSCKYQCTCMDGAMGCVPLCSMDIRLPSPDCPMPRRVKVPGKCCEEWECDSPYKDTLLGPALSGKGVSADLYPEKTTAVGTVSLILRFPLCSQLSERRRPTAQIPT